MEWPSATRTPAATSCAMKPPAPLPAPSVTSVTAVARRRQQSQIVCAWAPEHRRIVHAGLFRREERPFEMDAEHARLRSHGGLHRRERGAHLLRRVADQRRQQRRSCRTADARRRCAAMPRRRRRVVEQHIAAAVDLHVDEARRQPSARRQLVDRASPPAARAAARSRDALALDQHRAGRDARPCRRTRSRRRRRAVCVGHRVRVTFCRWRGRSTSMPSRSASCTSKRIKALDQAERVGFRMLGRQAPADVRTGRPVSGDQSSAAPLRRRSAASWRMPVGRRIGRHEHQDRIARATPAPSARAGTRRR